MGMRQREHEQWRDGLAAYLLGALGSSEVADLERHLAECEGCRAELSWLEPAIGTLSEAVPRVEPPPGLRARVIGEARSEVGQAQIPRRRHGRSLTTNRRGGGGQRFGFRPIIVVVALGLVLAAVGGYAVGGGGQGGGAASTILGGHPLGVSAEVIRQGEGGTLRLANVHQLPNGEVLQAWVRRGRRIVSADSLFAPARDGTATATIPNLGGVNAVMVTAEPSGGSERPTSPPIVTISVPQ
jgi:anti-sigma-K factor RskA